MLTKSFGLEVLLSVTTERLLTKRRGNRDNGIGDIYELLGWMTGESPFTHQLGRFGEECKPWLFRWFPELAVCGHGEGLDKWLESNGADGVKMWLEQMRKECPALQESYDVGKIPMDDHTSRNPIDELREIAGDKPIIVVEVTKEEGR